MTAKMPISGSPEKRRDRIAQLPLRSTSGGSKFAVHGLKSLRQLRIAELIVIEVRDRDAHAMLHFARTKVMQERAPLLAFFEVFGDMPGKENVTSVAAIHHSLCHVDPSAGEI